MAGSTIERWPREKGRGPFALQELEKKEKATG